MSMESGEYGNPLDQLEAEEAAEHAAQDPEPDAAESGETEPQRFAGKYETPEAMEQGYREAERTIGSQGQKIGDLEAQIAELRAAQEQSQQPAYQQWAAAQQQAQPQTEQDWIKLTAAQSLGLTVEQMDQLGFEHQSAVMNAYAMAGARYAVEVGRQELERGIAPLRTSAQSGAIDRGVALLKQEFGEEAVESHSQAIAETLSKLPKELYLDANGGIVHEMLRSQMKAALYDSGQTRVIQPRAENGQFGTIPQAARDVHVEGGSQGHTPLTGTATQQADEQDPDLRELLESGATNRDRFGGTPFDMPLNGRR